MTHLNQRSQQHRLVGRIDWDLVEVLMNDVTLACTALVPSADQYARRTAFRAAFAAVEGITAYLKEQALLRPEDYTSEELAVLREEGYALTDTGEISVSRRRLPSSFNFVFAARMAIRPLVPDFVMGRKDPGMLAFTRAIQVRHRITHPKHLDDVHISDQELHILIEALRWCYDLVGRFEEAVVAALKAAQDNIDLLLEGSVGHEPGFVHDSQNPPASAGPKMAPQRTAPASTQRRRR